MRVLCVDPGSEKSGWCLLEDGIPAQWDWQSNDVLLESLRDSHLFSPPVDHLVIEDISHYGKDISVGNDVFQTVRWTGRFDEAWGGDFTYIKRPTIKTFLCGIPTAKDKDVRQAIIDHYGGDAKAIGGKKCQACHGSGMRGRGKARGGCPRCHCYEFVATELTDDTIIPTEIPIVTQPRVGEKGCGYETEPGVLHGVSGHVWSAISVGLTWLAQQD